MTWVRAFLVACILIPATAGAGTLVVANGDSFEPGLASSWEADGDAVVLTLKEGVEADSVAKVLSDSLSGVSVIPREDSIVISGLPMDTLLGQLAKLPIGGGGADPLADLAGMGGAEVAFSAPEGGGSIRATNPSFSLADALPTHDPKARIEADVVAVDRSKFPQVTLKLRVRKRAADRKAMKPLKGKRTFEAMVLFKGDEGQVDFDDDVTQQNLGAYYLKKGDRVEVHLLHHESGAIRIDWLDRKR